MSSKSKVVIVLFLVIVYLFTSLACGAWNTQDFYDAAGTVIATKQPVPPPTTEPGYGIATVPPKN